jgi:3-deoxy-D-manno-octulosonic-acid transferase
MKPFFLLYAIGLRLAIAIVWILSFFNPKLRRLVLARRGLQTRLALFREAVPGKLWWFHVASAGEMEQAIPLMEKVRAREADSVIFVSFFSPSAEMAAANEIKRREAAASSVPWDYADYLCWDLPGPVRRYVALLKPDYFVSLHAELWPVLFNRLEKEKVAISIGAVHVPAPRAMSWSRRTYWKSLLAPVTRIATIDSETCAYLQEAFPQKNIQMLGDPRIDRVVERASRNKDIRKAVSEDSLEVLLASVEDTDWKAIKDWLAKPHETRIKLWIVPHEPKEKVMAQMEQTLAQAKLLTIRLSQLGEVVSTAFTANPEIDAVIVDKVGVLAELYARTELAFVGGSFQTAVHNVLEPAAYSVAIVTGPQIEKSCEATEMRNQGALLQTDSADSLAIGLDALIANERYRQDLGQRAKRFLTDRQGASERYGTWLGELQ